MTPNKRTLIRRAITRSTFLVALAATTGLVVAVPSTSAHGLTKSRAKAIATNAVKATASRTAASAAKVIQCKRRGRHRVDCSAYYAYTPMPGSPACISTVVVRLRKHSNRTHESQQRVRCGRAGTLKAAPGGGTPNGGAPTPNGGTGPLDGLPVVCNDGTIVLFNGEADPCANHLGAPLGLPPIQLPALLGGASA
jgi:hypothetical protein